MLKGHLGSLTRIAILCLLIPAARASAQVEPELDEDQAALALALAQVCANESALNDSRPGDCALIFQATRRHGATASERLAWLRRHSSCVLGTRERTAREMRGNCAWSRNLTASDAEPEGWPSRWSWERHAPRWARMRRYCAMLVAGWRPSGGWPCAEDPDTWGGTMDHTRARARGMRPVVCVGTVNEGYRYSER